MILDMPPITASPDEVLTWAERDGVDLTMLQERLRMTPTERLERHDRALCFANTLRKSLNREGFRMVQTERLLKALNDAGVRYVIIGGMAAIAQGVTYTTEDLDLCYERDPVNYQRISIALRPFSPRLRGVPPGLPFKFDSATIKSGLNFTLSTDAGDLDLLGEVSGLGFFEAVKASAVEGSLSGHVVSILNLEGLIASKQAAGRAKDNRLLPELRSLLAKQQKEKNG